MFDYFSFGLIIKLRNEYLNIENIFMKIFFLRLLSNQQIKLSYFGKGGFSKLKSFFL